MSISHTSNFIKCSTCSLKNFCLPMMLSNTDIDRLDSIIQRNKMIKKGTKIFSIGDRFTHIYAIRSGYLKSYSISESGEQQITGFHLPGEIIGFEGISTGSHMGYAEALVPSHICSIPFEKLDNLNSSIAGLRQQLFKMMSQEITHNHELMLLLNQKNADEKISTFLLNISARNGSGEGLSTEFTLPMTRTDMANYLGLALETVSRIVGKLVRHEIISVNNRQVTIKQLNHLSGLAGTSCHFNMSDSKNKSA